MTRERLVAVLGTDRVRRETIERAFRAAGFRTVGADRAEDLRPDPAESPLAFVLDSFQPLQFERELDTLRRRWGNARVWAVSETARLLPADPGNASPVQPDAAHISCEGILERALRALRSTGGAPSLDQRIARAKKEYESIFDSTPDPIFVLSDRLTIIRANKAFCDKLGMPVADVLGKHCVELLHGILDPWGRCLWAKVLESTEPLRWRLPEGALGGGAYECTTFRVVMADGSTGVVHHLRELHDPEHQADADETTARLALLGKMAAGLVHELNNPLAAVVGFAEVLERSGACPDELKPDLEQIQHEAWRCQRIVRNLLGLARTPRPDPRPTDLNELVERTVAVRAYQLEHPHVRIVRDLQPDLPPVLVDPDQVEQILLNLLSNAQEAALAGAVPPEVTVSTRITENEVFLCVADNGPGIPSDQLPFVFDPLYTTKPTGKGTGLGLSVSRTLARKHGGDISVRNLEGGGAAFTVRLPLRTAGAETGAARPGHHPPAARVLLVDDEPIVQDLVCKLLRADGHTVTASGTPEDVRRVLATDQADVVLIDSMLLELAGEELLRFLRDERPDLRDRLVITTGSGNEEKSPFTGYSAYPPLPKPFTPLQLRRSIEAVLARRFSSGGR